MNQTPYQSAPAPITQASAVRKRRAPSGKAAPQRKKPPVKLAVWQLAVLICLALGIVAAMAVDLVYGAKLTDLNNQREQEKAEYDRRVYRTTVKYRDLITKYAAEYAVHPAYIAAIVLNESSYDPSAVSSANARGLMQLLPSSGEWIAPKIGLKSYTDDVLYDAETNLRMGAWYIGYLSDKYDGDPILIACAYHAGAGNVDNWIKNYSTDGKTLTYEQIPYENSRSYARKVVNSYAIYRTHYYTD